MKLRHIEVILFFLLSSLFSLNAQINFAPDNDILNGSQKGSTYVLGAADINGDYFDDLIQIAGGQQVIISIQCPGDQNFKNIEIEDKYVGTPWTMAIADIDNDGTKEIMLAGGYDGVQIYGHTGNSLSGYENIQALNSFLFAQGANFVDLNGDQNLDLFACHDDGESFTWINSGSGNLVETNGLIDFSTVPVSDNSGNYASEWLDIDDDGDLDLHIAKCRTFANLPTDPRRINALYINDGNNQFSEQAAAFNVDIGRQSWVGTFADLDNDGDVDGFVLNHGEVHQLLHNHNNTFTQIDTDINLNGIQSIIKDFDNDGLLDILLTGPEDLLLHNDGNMAFTKIEDPFGTTEAYSAACGDFNNDGFMDVIANYSAGLAIPSTVPDQVFLNTTNSNNYIKISLEGTDSNLNAVGAKVLLYGAWGIQRRDIKGGEGYGIVNSFNLNFGLGTHSVIDSLVVYWPSGNKTVDTNLSINEHFLKIENNCLNPFLEVAGDRFICNNTGTSLSVDTTAPVVWSDGQSGSTIQVNDAGTYFARIDLGGGCFQQSKLACVKDLQEESGFFIETSGSQNLCLGEEVILSVGANFSGTQWSTNETATEIIVDGPGAFTASFQFGTCLVSDEIVVDMINPSISNTENDTTYTQGGAVSVYADGDSISWYSQAVGGTLLGHGNLYTTNINATSYFYAENNKEVITPDYSLGELDPGIPVYADSENGQLLFNAFKAFTLNSVDVYSDTPGVRTIELRDSMGIILQSAEIELVNIGLTRVALNFEVSEGLKYVLTTNTNMNVQNFGFESPRLEFSNNISNYPYKIDQLVSIYNTNFGTQLYFYFFNWQIDNPDVSCISERVEVLGVLEPSSTSDLASYGISISPNPSNGKFNIESPDIKLSTTKLLNSTGAILQNSAFNNKIDISDFMPGVYFLKLRSEHKIFIHKLIKL